jgi:hypothetical protein
MRQAAFLEFNYISNNIYRTKKISFLDIIHQNIQLHFEDMINNFWTINGMSLGGRAAAISGHAALEVNVIKRSRQPNFLQIPIWSWYF